jgi:hypothetical protein
LLALYSTKGSGKQLIYLTLEVTWIEVHVNNNALVVNEVSVVMPCKGHKECEGRHLDWLFPIVLRERK